MALCFHKRLDHGHDLFDSTRKRRRRDDFEHFTDNVRAYAPSPPEQYLAQDQNVQVGVRGRTVFVQALQNALDGTL